MAKITGATGSVTIPAAAGGQSSLVTRWSADISREIHDGTTFDDAGNARAKLGGAYDLKGTCEAWHDDTTSPVMGTIDDVDGAPTASFILTAYTGRTYTFTGILSNISVSVEKVGQARVTLSFESSGAVTIA